MKKNLIIGYFYNLKSFDGIKVFIKSGHQIPNRSFDMVLLDASDDDSGSALLNFAQDHEAVIEKTKKTINSLYVDRFRSFKEYLSNKKYDQIILIDCIDVYFQRDPFLDLEPTNKLILSSENIFIKDARWNYEIIKNVYGDQVANNFLNNTVINSGVLAGDSFSLQTICDLIVKEHTQNNKCFTGVDQGILMKIIYSGEYEFSYKFAPHYFSLMLAVLGLADKFINNYGINTEGITITDNSHKKYSIVHQYNREQNFNRKVLAHYAETK